MLSGKNIGQIQQEETAESAGQRAESFNFLNSNQGRACIWQGQSIQNIFYCVSQSSPTF
ncbi:hypothetical protein LHEJCM20397_04530 [Lactobacillus helveticus]|nr:hypothetical protein LHEJCM20397_04530 [Lactobacillus helveticus]